VKAAANIFNEYRFEAENFRAIIAYYNVNAIDFSCPPQKSLLYLGVVASGDRLEETEEHTSYVL
jgi:hypothetical protein